MTPRLSSSLSYAGSHSTRHEHAGLPLNVVVAIVSGYNKAAPHEETRPVISDLLVELDRYSAIHLRLFLLNEAVHRDFV